MHPLNTFPLYAHTHTQQEAEADPLQTARWESVQAAGLRREEAAGECDVMQGGGNPGN